MGGHVGRVLCVAVHVRVGWDAAAGAAAVRTLAATGSWDRSVRVWDLAAPAGAPPLHVLGGPEAESTCGNSAGHASGVSDAAFSPDGGALATGSEDETVRLWDVETGDELKRFEGHDNAVVRPGPEPARAGPSRKRFGPARAEAEQGGPGRVHGPGPTRPARPVADASQPG